MRLCKSLTQRNLALASGDLPRYIPTPMSAFEGLGKALRWLRARQDKRQYQVAEDAGVTKAMLSAYETGKQRPSLETLDKILGGLDASLEDLHRAILIVNGLSDPLRPPAPRSVLPGDGGGDVDLHQILGVSGAIPAEEEMALRQMLGGFHRLLRYMHQQLARLPE